jgi:hypothetical protein
VLEPGSSAGLERVRKEALPGRAAGTGEMAAARAGAPPRSLRWTGGGEGGWLHSRWARTASAAAVAGRTLLDAGHSMASSQSGASAGLLVQRAVEAQEVGRPRPTPGINPTPTPIHNPSPNYPSAQPSNDSIIHEP